MHGMIALTAEEVSAAVALMTDEDKAAIKVAAATMRKALATLTMKKAAAVTDCRFNEGDNRAPRHVNITSRASPSARLSIWAH